MSRSRDGFGPARGAFPGLSAERNGVDSPAQAHPAVDDPAEGHADRLAPPDGCRAANDARFESVWGHGAARQNRSGRVSGEEDAAAGSLKTLGEGFSDTVEAGWSAVRPSRA